MGTRSDVGIAMKEYVFQNLSEKAKKFLEEWGFEEKGTVSAKDLSHEGTRLTKDDLGTLFATSDVKWYHQDYEDIQAFYTHLNDCHDEEDYLIITACSEYPESEDGNAGEWDDNPFNLHKYTTVELSWD